MKKDNNSLHKKYSQTETEYIINNLILPKIKRELIKVCVELGAGDGLTLSNTAMLVRESSWFGFFFEKSNEANLIPLNYKDCNILSNQVFITAENVNKLLPEKFDLISIDIDGNDYWVWKAIKAKPAIVIVEYNCHKTQDWIVPYDKFFVENSGDAKYYGASLISMIRLGEEKGYKVLAIDEPNLFFVDSAIL